MLIWIRPSPRDQISLQAIFTLQQSRAPMWYSASCWRLSPWVLYTTACNNFRWPQSDRCPCATKLSSACSAPSLSYTTQCSPSRTTLGQYAPKGITKSRWSLTNPQQSSVIPPHSSITSDLPFHKLTKSACMSIQSLALHRREYLAMANGLTTLVVEESAVRKIMVCTCNACIAMRLLHSSVMMIRQMESEDASAT